MNSTVSARVEADADGWAPDLSRRSNGDGVLPGAYSSLRTASTLKCSHSRTYLQPQSIHRTPINLRDLARSGHRLILDPTLVALPSWFLRRQPVVRVRYDSAYRQFSIRRLFLATAPRKPYESPNAHAATVARELAAWSKDNPALVTQAPCQQ